MTFLAAVVVVLILLVATLLATSAHLLARVMRLEAAERTRREQPELFAAGEFAIAALRAHDAVPPAAANQLGISPDSGPLALVVVSAGCRSCRAAIDALCSGAGGSSGDRRIVVGHDADRVLMPANCAVPVVVSGALVESVVISGWVLPVLLRVDRGRVVSIVTATTHFGTTDVGA